MIITVTLNAALDVTYRVSRIELHASHRVSEVSEVAGGKGVNVASVLTQQGVTVLATGLLGGVTGERIRADLDARGIRHDFSPCAGESRRALTVVSEAHGDATVFNEPGPRVQPREWQRFLHHLSGLVERWHARVVVASGSLPPGVPADAYAEVVRVAREAGALSIVDSSAEALTAALPARPDLVKPNRERAPRGDGRGRHRRWGSPPPGARCPRGRRLGRRRRARRRRGHGWGGPRPAGRAAVGQPHRCGRRRRGGAGRRTRQRRRPGTPLPTPSPGRRRAVLHPLAGQARQDDIARLRPLVQVEQQASPRTRPGGHPC